MTIRHALVICPEGDPKTSTDRRLLGLTVGERLLLALETSGVDCVAFVGDGAEPASSRTTINIVSVEELGQIGKGQTFSLLPADMVFDRQLLQTGTEIPTDLPMRLMPFSELHKVASSPGEWLDRLGTGTGEQGSGFALRVTDRNAAQKAKRALLKSMRKPADGFVSRNINRHVSLFFTRLIIDTGIRPNQLTVLIMAMGVASALFAAIAEPWWMLLLAGLLFQGQSISDGCDGEIARLTYRFSHLGQWLDTIGDDLTNYLFCLGLAMGQARILDLPWLYVAGGITFVFQWATSAIMYHRIAKMGSGDLLAIPDTLTTGQYTGFLGQVLKFLRLITKRDFFVLVVAVITAAGQPLIAFLAMTMGTYPAFFAVAVNEVRLRRMDQSTSPE